MGIVENILMGIGAYTVMHFVITVLGYVFSKPGLPNNRPTPLNRKSFKERLEEKQRYASSIDDTISDDLKRYKDISDAAIKLGNTNPPKETGT